MYSVGHTDVGSDDICGKKLGQMKTQENDQAHHKLTTHFSKDTPKKKKQTKKTIHADPQNVPRRGFGAAPTLTEASGAALTCGGTDTGPPTCDCASHNPTAWLPVHLYPCFKRSLTHFYNGLRVNLTVPVLVRRKQGHSPEESRDILTTETVKLSEAGGHQSQQSLPWFVLPWPPWCCDTRGSQAVS